MAKTQNQFVFVIAGKDNGLINDKCDELINELVKPEQRAMALFSADTDKVQISEVFDELRTLPFLADKRVVLLRGADTFISKNRPHFEQYFQSPCPSGILILTVSTWKKNTKLAKMLGNIGQLIDMSPPSRAELPKLLSDMAVKKYDKTIDRNALSLLIELVGDELGPLQNELGKLALFVGERKSITGPDVEQIIGHDRIFSIFNVIDAILTGQIGQALERLRRMFAEDKSTEYTFLGGFAFQLRKMFKAKALLEKGLPQQQAAKQAGVFWNQQQAFFGQLRKLTLKQIGNLIENIAEVDYQIKTGQTTPKVAAEKLVLKLGNLG